MNLINRQAKIIKMPIQSCICRVTVLTYVATTFLVVCSTKAQCEITKLQVSDAAQGDLFGHSVAIDGARMIVGVPRDDDNATNTGAAYIYKHQGNSWIEEAKLVAEDPGVNDEFGISVDINGDFAIVGAHKNDQGGWNVGAAYIFRYIVEIDEWVQQQKILAPDSPSAESFGTSVAYSENLVIVGAPLGFVGRGTAYAFHFSDVDQSWVLRFQMLILTGVLGDGFGESVDIDGNNVLVGAKGVDINGPGSGAAYIFKQGVNEHENFWFEQNILLPSDGAAEDSFGESVAICGDNLVIGAPSDNNQHGSQAGAAYVFHYDSNTNDWNEQAKLIPTDGNVYGHFGSVAIDGNEILVGSPYHDIPVGFAGGAYIFQYSSQSSSWIELGKLIVPEINSGGWYGFGVGVSNGIGIVSSPRHNDPFSSAGAAFVFDVLANVDSNNNGIMDACEFGFADLNDDGSVDQADLMILLGFWGSCPAAPFECLGDLNGDQSVNTSDLLILIANWG